MPKIDNVKLPKEISDKYTLQNNALVQAVKTDWKDKISVEIGDTKDATTFQPQVKICRWDNEVNFSMRLKHDEQNLTVEFEGEKTKWKGEKVECHFYDKPEASEDGGHEFEIVLKSKPKTNILEFSIETKGLSFWRQPPLTEEFENGYSEEFKKEIIVTETDVIDSAGNVLVHRGEEYVDSVWIACNENKKNWTGGKIYRDGTLGYIHRIKATDANGVSVWGKQNIDIDKKLYTIELPQSFLDNAVYPLAVDPNFGYETEGSSNVNINTTIKGSIFPLTETGTLSSVTCRNYVYQSSDYNYAIYDSDLALVEHATAANLNNGGGWVKSTNTLNLDSTPAKSSGNYWIVENHSGNNHAIFYNTGDANQSISSDNNFASGFPSSIGTHTHGTRKYTIYATYTAGGGATNVEVTPSAVNATFATVAPTISAIRNIEATPAVQNITAAILAFAVGMASLFGATPVNATLATQTPTVLTVQAINISPAVQNGTLAIPASTVSTVRIVNATPVAQNGTFALPASTVSAIIAVNTTATIQNAVFALPASTVSAIRAVEVLPAANNGAFALPASAITVVRAINVAPNTGNTTFASVAPAVSVVQAATVSPSAQNAAFAVQSITITAIRAVNSSVGVQNSAFAIETPSISTVWEVNLEPGIQNGTFSVPVCTILAGSDISCAAINSTFAVPAIEVSAGTSIQLADSYPEGNRDAYYSLTEAGNSGYGQSFTAIEGILDSCKFFLGRIGSPANNLVAKIYAHTHTYGVDGHPIGDPLAVSDAISASSVPTGNFNLITFTFSGANRISLTNGTHYFVTVEGETTGWTTSHYISVGLDTSSSNHEGNGAGFFTSWAKLTFSYDFIFYLYEDTSVSPNVSVSPVSLNSTFALPAMTVSAVRTVNVLPSVLNAVFTASAAVVSGGENVVPGVQNGTFSALVRTITTGLFIEPSAQNAAFATQAVTVSAVRAININPATQNVSLGLLAVVISTETISEPGTYTAIFALPAVSVSAIRVVGVFPAVQSGIFALPKATIDSIQNVAVIAAVKNAAFSVQSPTVSAVKTVNVLANTGNVTFTASEVTITANASIIVLPDVLNKVFSVLLPTIQVEQNVNILAVSNNVIFALPEISVLIIRNVAVNAATNNANFALLAYKIESRLINPYIKKPSPYSKKTGIYSKMPSPYKQALKL